MIEERLSNEKTRGIEDAIYYLDREILMLNAEISGRKVALEMLENKRNSLNIGLVNLQRLQERAELQSSSTKASENE